MADNATWLPDDEVSASLCFLPFLSHRRVLKS
jgi:hypothetical protein